MPRPDKGDGSVEMMLRGLKVSNSRVRERERASLSIFKPIWVFGFHSGPCLPYSLSSPLSLRQQGPQLQIPWIFGGPPMHPPRPKATLAHLPQPMTIGPRNEIGQVIRTKPLSTAFRFHHSASSCLAPFISHSLIFPAACFSFAN